MWELCIPSSLETCIISASTHGKCSQKHGTYCTSQARSKSLSQKLNTILIMYLEGCVCITVCWWLENGLSITSSQLSASHHSIRIPR